jgi:hypothetical protein
MQTHRREEDKKESQTSHKLHLRVSSHGSDEQVVTPAQQAEQQRKALTNDRYLLTFLNKGSDSVMQVHYSVHLAGKALE